MKTLLAREKEYASLSPSQMKNLYPKGKGKVHPSPPFSQACSFSSSSDAHSVLKVLPAAILALTTALVMEDREVLAYMIAHSLNATLALEERRRCRRSHHQQRPAFDCGCFDCYTSFWIRWDASSKRELIHEVIEAFEEHLATAEGSEVARKRAKGKRLRNRSFWSSPPSSEVVLAVDDDIPSPDGDDATLTTALEPGEEEAPGECPVVDEKEERVFGIEGKTEAEKVAGEGQKAAGLVQSRSLVSKLVPDVMGFFASRLWTV